MSVLLACTVILTAGCSMGGAGLEKKPVRESGEAFLLAPNRNTHGTYQQVRLDPADIPQAPIDNADFVRPEVREKYSPEQLAEVYQLGTNMMVEVGLDSPLNGDLTIFDEWWETIKHLVLDEAESEFYETFKQEGVAFTAWQPWHPDYDSVIDYRYEPDKPRFSDVVIDSPRVWLAEDGESVALQAKVRYVAHLQDKEKNEHFTQALRSEFTYEFALVHGRWLMNGYEVNPTVPVDGNGNEIQISKFAAG
ncbi:hypothetical protein FDW83_03005 [Pseudarthrobacter sp. NamE2]|uniref:hypothetical protein n=1 Tax=Pseudarthrobacter sp. NamE2 TaxID=2576838 RepID=UPI0010FDD451|nr:hypothetical protein [Pseudarthrobacter sp. NamE2]TLM85371.1 hypothetical protein FDW83_03005 [Pseudarthrobacter sp. NamE2]